MASRPPPASAMTTIPASCSTSRSILRASGSSSTTMTRSGSSSRGPEPSRSCCDMSCPPKFAPYRSRLPRRSRCRPNPRTALGMKLHRNDIGWVFSYPTAARAAPWGVIGNRPAAAGRRGGEPHGAAAPPRVRRCTIGRPRAARDRAQPKVAPTRRRLRVSCTKEGGGKTRRRVGYELPLPEGIRHALIPRGTTSIGLGGWGMVGQDADRGDSRGEQDANRRRVWGADRRDLEAGSLASWSRSLDDRRRELLAGVGHELKTPLSIVLGLCGRLLADDELGAEHARDVERVRANAYVLLKRVDELLQVSRLDAGHLAVEPRDVDVAALVRASCEGFASVAETRRQRLTLEAPAGLRARVDEEKVLSVVSNLLANALKHAPAGGLVRCSVSSADGRLRIEVADNGPGVAVDQRREIFERYRQGAGSASRPGGSGLGLAIVRELVALHNGRVTLADAPEGGALFVVDLPLVSPAAGAAEAPPTIDIAERQRATVERLRA